VAAPNVGMSDDRAHGLVTIPCIHARARSEGLRSRAPVRRYRSPRHCSPFLGGMIDLGRTAAPVARQSEGYRSGKSCGRTVRAAARAVRMIRTVSTVFGTGGSAPIPADTEATARPLRSSWFAGARIPGHTLILRASCVTRAP
jgi:hypothetical protein